MAYIFARTEWNSEWYCKTKGINLTLWTDELMSWWGCEWKMVGKSQAHNRHS